MKVAPMTKEITKKRLKWYGHVKDGSRSQPNGGCFKRRDEWHVLRRMLDAPVPGKRRRGRQKTMRKD